MSAPHRPSGGELPHPVAERAGREGRLADDDPRPLGRRLELGRARRRRGSGSRPPRARASARSRARRRPARGVRSGRGRPASPATRRARTRGRACLAARRRRSDPRGSARRQRRSRARRARLDLLQSIRTRGPGAARRSSSAASSASATATIARAASAPGSDQTRGSPRSPASRSRRSSGTVPSSATPTALASSLASAGAEHLGGHVLDDADHAHVRLLRHQRGPRRHLLGQGLRRGHDHGLGARQELAERDRDVAGAGRHVHEQVVELAPVHVGEELLERAVQHRPAPHDRRVLVEEEADRHQLHVRATAGRSSCRRRRAAGRRRAGAAPSGRRCPRRARRRAGPRPTARRRG